MTSQLYKANGEITNVEPENGKAFSLKEMQRYVGGYIEITMLSPRRSLVCNEDGKLLNLVVNNNATALYQGSRANITTVLVGDVLICDDNLIQ
jgi:hypothetical protein